MANRQIAPAWIEKSIVLEEGTDKPRVGYNLSINDKDITDISYEQLVTVRDMIDKITKEK